MQWADAAEASRLTPHIDENLRVCQEVVDAMILAHRAVGDLVDFDLEAGTRWVAMWELSGRCLGLANLLLAELRLGFTAEAGGTVRALHEALNLLAVATFEEDGVLTRQWLRGRNVSQKRANAARRDAYDRIASEAEEMGLPIDPNPNIVALTGRIYGTLSGAAHSTRPGFQELIARDARNFAYGPHPSFGVRAQWVDYANLLVEQAVLDVGGALMHFFGRDWFPNVVMPLVGGLERVRRD